MQIIDRDLSVYAKSDELLEAKFAYIDKRTAELHEARTAGIPSDEDFIIALERMATLPELMKILKRQIYEREPYLPDYIAGAIRGALRLDCASIAATEANALFDESSSTARH